MTSYQYDGLDRLTRLRDAKGVTTVSDHQYQYDTASQITQIAEPTNTRSYGHDAVDRLTAAAYTNPAQPNENYAYDGVGNRSSSHLSASYGYQSFNRLTSTSTASYTDDTNGNLISKTDSSGTTQYAWDFENRLKQVTLPNGNIVRYKYDALGRRVQRVPSTGVSTNFIHDGQEVLKDLNSDGSTVDYLNGPGIDNKLRFTDSRLAATGPLYFLQDHLGSTTALTNSLGNIGAQISYDGFGNSAGSSLTRYDYTGRERDPDTGLMYYRARWYDPQVGRFISEDPIFLEGGLNLYGYVGNNSLKDADPFGLSPQSDIIEQAFLDAGTVLLQDCYCANFFGAATKRQKERLVTKTLDSLRQNARTANIDFLARTTGTGGSAIISLGPQFFGDAAFRLSISGPTIPRQGRAETILHELAHALGLIPQDGYGFPADQAAKNDEKIIRRCRKGLSKLGK